AAAAGHVNLALGQAKTAADLFLAVAATLLEALDECRLIGRQDKEEQRIGIKIADLKSALHVDLQQHILALGKVCQHRRFWSAVIFAIDLGVFQEFIAVETFEEFFLGDELVSFSLVVARPLGTGGGGHRVRHAHRCGQLPRDGGLTDPGRPAETDELPGLPGHINYSTFWTCSFNRSIEPLIYTMCLAIS